MERQETQQPETARECRHYLWLTIKPGNADATLWARCRYCRRGWFLGSQAEVLAGLTHTVEQMS